MSLRGITSPGLASVCAKGKVSELKGGFRRVNGNITMGRRRRRLRLSHSKSGPLTPRHPFVSPDVRARKFFRLSELGVGSQLPQSNPLKTVKTPLYFHV